eukprot:8076114-Ditylum_brightwellii.AAC.2
MECCIGKCQLVHIEFSCHKRVGSNGVENAGVSGVKDVVLDPSTLPGIPAARQPSLLPVDEIHVVRMLPPTLGAGKLLSAMDVILQWWMKVSVNLELFEGEPLEVVLVGHWYFAAEIFVQAVVARVEKKVLVAPVTGFD